MSALPSSPRRRAFAPAAIHPVVRVVEEDPQLVGSLDAELVPAARQHLVARALRLRPGGWDPAREAALDRCEDWLGLLILEGTMVRQLDVDGLRCCELLGPGDVLRPWDEDDAGATLECRAAWRVLEPVRLALLDGAFARRAGRWPTVVSELMHRGLRRSRSLSVLLSATQARRAEVRLRAVFWHLADRWGRVTPDGVVLELRLTHTLISQLTGLRRPSVSLTLGKLEETGELVRLDKDVWLIRRLPSHAALAA